jgi:hypothetical protein
MDTDSTHLSGDFDGDDILQADAIWRDATDRKHYTAGKMQVPLYRTQ